MASKHPLLLKVLAVGALLALMAGCQPTTPPPAPPPTSLPLEGLWLVTPDVGTEYGSGGTTTLEFGASSGGSATFLSQSAANGILTCESHVYGTPDNNVLLLDGTFYTVTVASADRLVLESGSDRVTLNRVTGTPPVTPCGQAEAKLVKILATSVSFWSNLNSVGNVLYFNLDDSAGSLVGYDVLAGTLGTPRTYTVSVSGGTHRFPVAARTTDRFYGQCACGGSTSLDFFDLSTNTSVTHVDTRTDLMAELGIRYGYFDGTQLVIGGNDRPGDHANRLLTLNPDTLALVTSRFILEGTDEEERRVEDITLRGTDLLALVGNSIVVVGADGRATQTVKLTGLATSSPRGLTTVGSTLYVLDETADNKAALYEVTMP